MDNATLLPLAERLSIAEAAKQAGTHPNTITRWRLNGVRGVRLRCQRIGGRFFTTKQWLSEFVAALTGVAPNPTQRVDLEAQCLAAGV